MQAPLLILAPPRSFTTVTCAMLGNHPQMFGLAETNLFFGETVGELALYHMRLPRASHGLLRSIAELGFGEQTVEGIEAAKAWLEDNSDLSTAELFRILGEWADGKVLIDKSPAHVFRPGPLERMRAEFPDARFLHLTRHPAPMWLSVKETREKIQEVTGRLGKFLKLGNNALMAAAGDVTPDKSWLDPHMHILEFLDGVPDEQQMRLRGEDLLAEPKPHLKAVCEWLGVRDDDEAIDAMLHPERSPFAAYGPPNARFGNDPKFMESPELRPYKPRTLPLDGVDGKEGRVPFSDTLQECARLLGY